MAVADPQQPQDAQPNPHVQTLIDAAQVGATIQAGKAAVVAPAVVPAIPAVVAAKIIAAPRVRSGCFERACSDEERRVV